MLHFIDGNREEGVSALATVIVGIIHISAFLPNASGAMAAAAAAKLPVLMNSRRFMKPS